MREGRKGLWHYGGVGCDEIGWVRLDLIGFGWTDARRGQAAGPFYLLTDRMWGGRKLRLGVEVGV